MHVDKCGNNELCILLIQEFPDVKNIFYHLYHCNNFFFYLWQSVNIFRNRSILNFYLRPYLNASGPFVPDKAIRTCQPLLKETEF